MDIDFGFDYNIGNIGNQNGNGNGKEKVSNKNSKNSKNNKNAGFIEIDKIDDLKFHNHHEIMKEKKLESISMSTPIPLSPTQTSSGLPLQYSPMGFPRSIDKNKDAKTFTDITFFDWLRKKPVKDQGMINKMVPAYFHEKT